MAKEAGDITILDDNFSSIEKAILYGRTMFKSIRKFLIFQLTVNVAAVLDLLPGPMLGENVVMTVIQLLLINLAMDTLAAIAFGSEPGPAGYMKEKPIPARPASAGKMMVEIIISALYITLFVWASCLSPPSGVCSAMWTLLSEIASSYFMMAITFNGFKCPHLPRQRLRGPGPEQEFPAGHALHLRPAICVRHLRGEVLSVEALSPSAWLTCLGLAFLVIPIDMARKALCTNPANSAATAAIIKILT